MGYMGLHGVTWVYMPYHDITCGNVVLNHIMGLAFMLLDYLRYDRVTVGYMGYQGVSWGYMLYHGVACNIMGSCVVSWDYMW